jgi:methyltransferase (TIGR00027 family)
MIESRPSRTANRVAMRRAAHQLLDTPKVLDDPLAVRILSPESQARLADDSPFVPAAAAKYMRAFMVARARLAEDELALAVARGALQFVVLGAGLDTFGCRNPYPGLRVFEVDYPSTQAWKRDRLLAGGITVPDTLTFAPVDFEKQSLAEGLRDAGFDPAKITFFSWLGVIMYLTSEAASSTLKFIAATPPGGGVVFDYSVPRETLNFLQKMAFDRLTARVEKAGEPFRLFFAPLELAALLRSMGFRAIEDLGSDQINARFFVGRSDGLKVGGGLARLMSAGL